MALSKQFSNKLDDLWKRRTNEVRKLVIQPSAGKPKKFTRSIRDVLIADLLEIATNILVSKEGNRELNKIVIRRKLRNISGNGLLARGDNLVDWAEEHFGTNEPIVYGFWHGKHCLYVGKGKGWKRLRDYRKSAYLVQATNIEVFSIKGKSQVAKAECLAKHVFLPRDNVVKPAKVKWGKSCPVCEKHDSIRDEMNYLFAMK